MVEPSRTAMTKADLISVVAKRLDITQVQAGIIVEAALRSIVSALQNGQEVEIRGFGSFRFRNRAPRKGRNPKTGEKVDVPPKKIPYFKMGKELKALLNSVAAPEEAPLPPPLPKASSRPAPPRLPWRLPRRSGRPSASSRSWRRAATSSARSACPGFLTDLSSEGGASTRRSSPRRSGTTLDVEAAHRSPGHSPPAPRHRALGAAGSPGRLRVRGELRRRVGPEEQRCSTRSSTSSVAGPRRSPSGAAHERRSPSATADRLRPALRRHRLARALRRRSRLPDRVAAARITPTTTSWSPSSGAAATSSCARRRPSGSATPSG